MRLKPDEMWEWEKEEIGSTTEGREKQKEHGGIHGIKMSSKAPNHDLIIVAGEISL